MKTIILLGSTGSIGKNVLDIVRRYPDKFRIKALCANENIDLLVRQAEEFRPEKLVIRNKGHYGTLKQSLSYKADILAEDSAMEGLASDGDSDVVFIAISGTSALGPLVSAVKAGKLIALASKEPIVSAGEIIMKMVSRYGAKILPVDSEHSAIMQCIGERTVDEIDTLYITGSGGPLWGKKEPASATMEEVLAHPKWNMGKKITVDSATLMNKGLEVIETRWLFGVDPEKIKVIIHPEAIIHSMVEFADGTIRAVMFHPDMRFPILRALSYPGIQRSDLPRVDFSALGKLSFSGPDEARFPSVNMAFGALKTGGTAPAVLNASNEKAVNLFLEGKIRFPEIITMVKKVTESHKAKKDPSLGDIIDAEKWASEEVLRSC